MISRIGSDVVRQLHLSPGNMPGGDRAGLGLYPGRKIYAQHRDAETWNQALEQAVNGLPVKVIQSTGDEAKGILAHVRDGLGAHHSPDLFHGQHELHKATSLPLQSQISQASEAESYYVAASGSLDVTT